MEIRTDFYLGDCADVLKKIPDNCIDLIFTSPPYADQRKNTYGGITPSKYVEWFLPKSEQFLRVLKPTGTFILNIKEKVVNGERSTYVMELIIKMKKQGWLWTRYIVTIKSGPNWGNSSQIAKMRTYFKIAIKTLRTSNSNLHVLSINGCCYGRDNKPDKGDYFKYCGQSFWEFISGNKQLYTDIIEPLGYRAKERNDDFQKSYADMINSFTREFTNNFCLNNGSINWDKLVEFNSSKE